MKLAKYPPQKKHPKCSRHVEEIVEDLYDLMERIDRLPTSKVPALINALTRVYAKENGHDEIEVLGGEWWNLDGVQIAGEIAKLVAFRYNLHNQLNRDLFY